MTHASIPPLPPLNGARYVEHAEGGSFYRAVGFQRLTDIRCAYGKAILAWRNGKWTIELGYLDGAELQAWNRLQRKLDKGGE